jgi:hypothetical protein
MEPIRISPTETTPRVILDHTADQFEIGGESRPENARKFYGPIIEWFDKYNQFLYWLKNDKGDGYKKDLQISFTFDYLNSTSIKFVYDLLKKIEELKANSTNLRINWHYEPGDEDMKESGEEYARMISLDFNIVSR